MEWMLCSHYYTTGHGMDRNIKSKYPRRGIFYPDSPHPPSLCNLHNCSYLNFSLLSTCQPRTFIKSKKNLFSFRGFGKMSSCPFLGSGQEREEKIPHMCGSLGHRPLPTLQGRCHTPSLNIYSNLLRQGTGTAHYLTLLQLLQLFYFPPSPREIYDIVLKEKVKLCMIYVTI